MKTYCMLTAMALFLMFLAACASTGTTQYAAAHRSTPAPTISANQQATCSPHVAPWSPVGKTWKLAVTFEMGSRAGQPPELSYMTFLPDGSLTATFPSQTSGQPDVLPAAQDGHWCSMGPALFAYTFKDPLVVKDGQMSVYVQTAISATMTSASTYTGDGVGVAYQAATAMPVPGLYNVTATTAVAVSSSR